MKRRFFEKRYSDADVIIFIAAAAFAARGHVITALILGAVAVGAMRVRWTVDGGPK